jgi:hypothetical protein
MHAEVVHLDDVGMPQPGDGLCLCAETLQVGRAGVLRRADHLQGHDPAQGGLPGLVDHSHAALAELAQDLLAGHGVAVQEDIRR